MTEQQLRELATALRQELDQLIDEEDQRARVAANLDDALALPEGKAREALMTALRADTQAREWVAARTPTHGDAIRAVPGYPGIPLVPLGVHFVCPEGDFDTYVETPNDDAGRCPHDGRKLVRADD